jgi:hypothetical protein
VIKLKIRFCQNRIEYLIFYHFGPFPDEKYAKLTILDHF